MEFSVDSIKDAYTSVYDYFASQTQTEQIVWGVIALGVILLIIGLVLL